MHPFSNSDLAVSTVGAISFWGALAWALLLARETRFHSCLGMIAGVVLGWLIALYFSGSLREQTAHGADRAQLYLTLSTICTGLGALLGVFLGARRRAARPKT